MAARSRRPHGVRGSCLLKRVYSLRSSGVWLGHFRLQSISENKTMLGKSYRSLSALVPFVLVLSALTAVVSGQTGQPSTATGEWPTYNADLNGTRYSPLDQINGSNFKKLEIAWRFKADHVVPC